MRFESNGIFFVFIILANRGSFIALSFKHWLKCLSPEFHPGITSSHTSGAPSEERQRSPVG
jgi:hypothetical protein